MVISFLNINLSKIIQNANYFRTEVIIIKNRGDKYTVDLLPCDMRGLHMQYLSFFFLNRNTQLLKNSMVVPVEFRFHCPPDTTSPALFHRPSPRCFPSSFQYHDVAGGPSPPSPSQSGEPPPSGSRAQPCTGSSAALPLEFSAGLLCKCVYHVSK